MINKWWFRKELKKFIVLLAITPILLLAGCVSSDPYPEDMYIRGDVYTWNGTGWELLLSSAGGNETDPIWTASPSHGITAANILTWNSLVSSQWVTDANGIEYTLGNIGIGTPSIGTSLVNIYSNAASESNPTLKVEDNSSGTNAIYAGILGAKTDNTFGIRIENFATSGTANKNKYGLYINSGAVWNGVGSKNYGLFIDTPTGGIQNIAAYIGGATIISGALDMDTHQINNVVNPILAQDVATKIYVDNAISANITGFVPYTGANATLNLGAQNLSTTNNITVGKLQYTNPTELTISGGAVTKTQGYHTVDTEGDVATDYLDTINGGSIGDMLTLAGASDSREVKLTRLGNIRFQPNHLLEGFSFNSPAGGSGTFYVAGYYDAPITSVHLTNASPTQTYGTANSPYGAHAFLVASGAGTTNAGTVSIVVSGTSISLDGVRAAGSETIVADITTMALNKYYETTKLWIGQITYTLTPVGGAAIYGAYFNYGFAAYDSMDERIFHITDFEVMGRAGANDANFDVQLLHHRSTGWTYSVAAFIPGDGAICSLATDYAADNDLKINERFKYERNVDVAVDGTIDEGFLIRIITSANKAVEFMNASVYAEAVPNDIHLKHTGQAVQLIYNGTYWMQY